MRIADKKHLYLKPSSTWIEMAVQRVCENSMPKKPEIDSDTDLAGSEIHSNSIWEDENDFE